MPVLVGLRQFPQTLGNTNVQILPEIRNGEGNRRLRRRLTQGSLEGHPCGNSTAYRQANGRQ
jgi:hypothetical protein